MILKDEKSQIEARDYVLNKPLVRPSITIWAPIGLFLTVVALGCLVGFVIANTVHTHFATEKINTYAIIIGVVSFLLLCAAKPMLILCIRCYQHYVPEMIRRSCLCKPTCSEYAIMVIKRYCLLKALVLIYIRLFRTCTGKTYKIDFPYK